MNSSKPISIYLADLTHEGTGRLAVDMMPYNIGLIAAYAKKSLGESVQIRLFKYVRPLLEALRERPPDILGLSNYVWNFHLSEFACEVAKSIRPDTLTVFGGTNYPFDSNIQHPFMKGLPFTDFHLFYEGENSFVHLVKAYEQCPNPWELRQQPIDGCHALSPKTGELVKGNLVPRIKVLDEVPSPYVSGWLDEFFDGRLVPLLETNRGCPFTCNFCNAGDSYFTKVSMFSLEHLEHELSYIAARISAVGVSLLVLADNNFGMYPRDTEICRILKRLQDRYGWPLRIISTTGKNNKERIIAGTEILGRSMSINMSVQSMNQEVLKNIKRQNVSLDTYKQVNEVLVRQGRIQKAEVIVPLPGETFQTFMQGLKELMDSRAQLIYSYTLQLLHGTEYKDPQYRKKWGYEGKWRLVPLNFGEYEGRKIFDVEEVAVKSGTLSFDEYLKIRVTALLTETMYNDYQVWEFVKFLLELDLSPFDWIMKTLQEIPNAPESIQRVVDDFLRDTKEELWDSEEELFEFYRRPENYERLLRGEAGHNVVFTHKGVMISRHLRDWVSFIAQTCLQLIEEKRGPLGEISQVGEQVLTLEKFLLAKLEGVLQKEANLQDLLLPMEYDILSWLHDPSGKPLKEFRCEVPVTYRFTFSEEQLRERQECLRRYGFDRIGLARIFARNPSLNTLYRGVESVKDSVALTPRESFRPAWNN